MADKIWYIVMVPMVYFAVVWSVVGIMVRIIAVLKTPKMLSTLRIFPDNVDPDARPVSGLAGALWDAFTMPSLRRYNPLFWGFLVVFHLALFALIIAHLDLLPQINIMPAESEHMIGNGAVGLIVTVCLLYFLMRRFRGPVREVSVPADFLILLLLLSIAVTGDMISWGNSWSESGFVITKKDLGAYLESLFTFTFADPRQFMTGSHYTIVGIHVLLANLFLLALPFSKIMHAFFAAPLNKLRRG